VLRERQDIAVFHDHLANPHAVLERLLPLMSLCMRERTPLPRKALSASQSQAYCLDGIWKRVRRCGRRGDHGIAVVTRGMLDPTIEFPGR